jgi:hypothetical protein
LIEHIRTAVSKALKAQFPEISVHGYDTKEGYQRPSFFVYVTQTFSAPTKNFLHVSADVEIDLIQKKTDEREAHGFFAQMQELFCRKLPVEDAFVNTSDLYMDIQNGMPIFGFGVEYWEDTKKPVTADLMQEFTFNEKVEGGSEMGLPAMKVIFTAAAVNAIRRSDRGAVGMVLKEENIGENNPVTLYKKSDIPKEWSGENREQAELALVGADNAPSKVVIYCLEKSAEDYTEALDYFALQKVTWIVCPTVETDKQTQAVAEWVKEQREERNKVKAVLPNVAGDHEGIVNYVTESVSIGDKNYTAEQFCGRIAGLLAGTSMKKAATFTVLDDVTDCVRISRDTANAEIDAGKFILFHDGEKVKVGRAVNSLMTITAGKSAAWKKIKVIETMDMIYDDLLLLVEDNYIGKYPNTYDNKYLLLSAINSYFAEVAHNGLIENYTTDFDVEAIRDYLVKYKGMDFETAQIMPDTEVKKQYTDEKVFMCATMNVVDVMEDITMNITV